MCVSAMRVATIEEVIGGRLRLHYDDAKVLYIYLLANSTLNKSMIGRVYAVARERLLRP